MSIEDSSGEVVIYTGEDGRPVIEVTFQGETAWLTQAQLVELFQSSKANISEHITNIFSEGELDESSVVREFRTTAADGKSYNTKHYNLDMILSLGYRVRSRIATNFRIWATERLREYIVKGFTMNDDLLKQAGGGSYWKELLDRIRDIRSSEKVLYRQVLDLYATSVDYDPRSEESKLFFKTVQNKLHYGAHGRTAAEVIMERADAGKPFMGLMTFSGELPRLSDAKVAKNYLDDRELQRLNTLVSAYFDAAEFRATNHEQTYMADWLSHLDRLIVALEGDVLDGAGGVSHDQAMSRASSEYRKYKATTKDLSSVEKSYLETIKSVQKKIERSKKGTKK